MVITAGRPTKENLVVNNHKPFVLGCVKRGVVPIFLDDTPVVLVDGKMDLLGLNESDLYNPKSGNFAISATEGWGLDSLRSHLIEIIGADVIDDPLSLPEGWHRKHIPE